MAKNFQPLLDDLRALTEQAKGGRLSPTDEQRGVSIYRELFAAGGKTTANLLGLSAELPWFIPAAGTVEEWPKLTPARRRNVLSALKPLETEAAKRMRLSVSRGLFKIDPESALKLLISTLPAANAGGPVEARDRQIFYHVLIGKSKPWLLQIDLKSLPKTDAELLARYAAEACVLASPPSAMSILQWGTPFLALANLPEAVQTELAKSFRKWSSRWSRELQKLDLPPLIQEAVATKQGVAPANRPQPAAPPRPPENGRSVEQSSAPAGTPPASGAVFPARPPQHGAPAGTTGKNQGDSSGGRKKRDQGEKPAGRTPSDIAEFLREIETRFNELRGELHHARLQLQQNKQAGRREGRSEVITRDQQKLQEENARLTETVTELRATLNELSQRNFDEATSRSAGTETPITDPVAQYQSLLTLRLREEITAFQEVNRENHVDAWPLLLDTVFRVLENNGIDLSKIVPPPAPARRRY